MQNSHCKCVNASDDVNDNDDERTRKVLVIEPHNVLSPPGDALDRLVPGLKLVENFITVDEEDEMTVIDKILHFPCSGSIFNVNPQASTLPRVSEVN